MLTYVLFVLGFALLVGGAKYLVDGSGSIALRMGIAPIVIGLTIVSMGTSAPELIVSTMAALRGSADIAVGNVVGSNIVNVLLILGLSAVIRPLAMQVGLAYREIPLMVLASLAVLLLGNDVLLGDGTTNTIGRGEGLMLMLMFAGFLYYLLGSTDKAAKDEAEEEIASHPLWLSALMIVGGIAALAVGGQWIVNGAVQMATALGMSEQLIGLTIVAVGTSLPELATSVTAALKGNADIAVGNVVGSNIFNVFWILGLTATISPLPYATAMNADVLVSIAASLLLLLAVYTGKKHKMDRWEGAVLLVLCVAYFAFVVVRG